jgi:alkaline phosphatase
MHKITTLGLATCLALGIACGLAAQETRLVRFGVITDTHVCDKGDQSNAIAVTASPRYFTGGAAKLEAFAQAQNKAGSAFVVELGDFTDNPADGSLAYDKRRALAFGFAETAEAKFAQFKGPRYHVFGNHDTDQLAKEDYLTKVSNTDLKLPAGQFYYSYDSNGVHFIVLDASYKKDGAAYSGVPAAGASGSNYTWDDANVPATEMDWLKADLAATKLPTVVFSHQELNPQELVEAGFDTNHIIKQAAEIRGLFEKSGKVLAVFSGHYHDGGFQVVNGINYVVLQANAAYGNDASYHNQFATVDVSTADRKNYRIAVQGSGMQKHYVLSASVK